MKINDVLKGMSANLGKLIVVSIKDDVFSYGNVSGIYNGVIWLGELATI